MRIRLQTSISRLTRAGLFAALAMGCSSSSNKLGSPTSSETPNTTGSTDTTAADSSDDSTGSEVATSVVSGSLMNNGADATMGYWRPHRSATHPGLEWLLDELNPIGTAHAATWGCTGRTLDPSFAGPGTYTYTPGGCSISGDAGSIAAAEWSGSFQLVYGTECDSTHRSILRQAAGCSLNRTTEVNGNTRTFSLLGSSYAITHDTHGAGTGWDASVSPAPSNGGVTTTCGSNGCASGLTLQIDGSHLLGTLTLAGGAPQKIWDHTVSTGSGGVTVSRSGGSMTATGTVVVQHNLAKFTSTTSFDHVEYGDANCCFPTGGSVSTTFASGPSKGKTETLEFSSVAACGAAKLTRPDGTSAKLTLRHCL